jgi:hypothetical protein
MKNISFLKMIKIEFYKLKHLKSILVVLLLPFFFVITGIANAYRYKDIMLNKHPWTNIYEQSAIIYGGIFFPIIIAMVMLILTRIEFKENNLNRMFSMPIEKYKFYLSKFVVGCSLLFIDSLLLSLICAVSGILCGYTNVPMYVLTAPIIAALSMIPAMAVHYYIAITHENIGLPLFSGIIALILTMFISATKYWYLFPWSYSGKLIMFGSPYASDSTFPPLAIIFSVLIFTLFTYLGIKHLNKIDAR